MFSINSYKGEILPNRTKNSKELLQKIVVTLERKKARNVHLKDDVIFFKGPTVFLIYLGNPLYHIAEGSFQVKTISSRTTIFFKVFFKLYLMYCNIFILICSSLAIFFLPTEPALSSIVKISYIFIFSIMAFGITHFLPMLTFYSMVRKFK